MTVSFRPTACCFYPKPRCLRDVSHVVQHADGHVCHNCQSLSTISRSDLVSTVADRRVESFNATICLNNSEKNQRLYDRSGDGKHCRKTAWGCIVLAYSVIAWGDPLFATRGQWRRRASDSDETPPIDLLLLYCVRRPTVFSRF